MVSIVRAMRSIVVAVEVAGAIPIPVRLHMYSADARVLAAVAPYRTEPTERESWYVSDMSTLGLPRRPRRSDIRLARAIGFGRPRVLPGSR